MPNNISVFKTAKISLRLELVTGSYSAYFEPSKAQLHTHSSLCSILDTAYLVVVVRVREQLGCLSDVCKLVLYQ